MKRTVLILTLALSACFEQKKSTLLEYVHDVPSWVDSSDKQALELADAQLKRERSALLTIDVVPDNPIVFAPISSPPSAQLSKSNEPKPEKKSAVSIDFVGEPWVSNVYTPPPVAAAKSVYNLSGADVADIKYVGLMKQGNQAQGLVKVGERLYPIRVGDSIGLGKWRVLTLNEHNMQLQIANKAIVYEKN